MSFLDVFVCARMFCALIVAVVLQRMLPQALAIRGGQEASPNQFPYQASLRKYDTHTCGGTIISANFILTAAHCATGKAKNGTLFVRQPEDITVQVGSSDRTQGGVIVAVSNITVHELYNFNMHDVALLRLAQPLNFSSSVQAIPLSQTTPPVGSSVIVSGWGRLATKGDRPEQLQWITVNVISENECEKRIQISSERLICMDHLPSVGPCIGDSGGPAVFDNKLVGISNFIIKGCGSRKPDVYANVAYYLPWIRNNSDIIEL